MNEEEKALGIVVEETKMQTQLEEIIERENLAEEELSKKKKKVDNEKMKAANVRQPVMKSLA